MKSKEAIPDEDVEEMLSGNQPGALLKNTNSRQYQTEILNRFCHLFSFVHCKKYKEKRGQY
jgi:hypothetical protein